jgi:hypothetical protein
MTSEHNWWVSGGIDDNNRTLQSSEVRWANGTWGIGPLLPKPVHGHCVVQVSRHQSVVIGGSGDSQRLAYTYDWITKVIIFRTFFQTFFQTSFLNFFQTFFQTFFKLFHTFFKLFQKKNQII